MTDDVREYWDAQAESFDKEADHGLADPVVRRAWEALLLPLIPQPGSAVADLGCGTGTLSLLLGGAGHRVKGVDLSANMVDIARAKAARAGLAAEFVVGDASLPPLPPASFDVVLARHVLWALPDPDAAVEHWARLLRPSGSMIFVEGLWGTGAGIPAEGCLKLVRRHRREATLTLLTAPDLWGREITDERYLIMSPA